LVRLGVETIEQRRFARYRTDSLAAGAPVRIAFPAARLRIDAFLPYIVGLVVVAMGVGLWIALKRSQPSAISSQQ
jgi:predicted hotdog family 3-hydroxylacyl-ACP dehydratase